MRFYGKNKKKYISSQETDFYLSDNIYNCNFRWEKKKKWKLEGIMFRSNQIWKRSRIELHIAPEKEHFNLYKRHTSSTDECLCI